MLELDGADIDWEFPQLTSDTNGFQALMSALYAAFAPKGYLLTAAMSSLYIFSTHSTGKNTC